MINTIQKILKVTKSPKLGAFFLVNNRNTPNYNFFGDLWNNFGVSKIGLL